MTRHGKYRQINHLKQEQSDAGSGRRRQFWLLLIGVSAGVTVLVGTLFPLKGAEAYLTDTESVTAPLTLAKCQVEITEAFDENVSKSPGIPFQKRVQIRNTGTTECYVRVRMIFSDSEAAEASLFSIDGENYFPMDQYPEAALTNGWTVAGPSGEDGFYYYRSVLRPEEITQPLLESLRTDLSNDYDFAGQDYELTILSEAVQARDQNGALTEEFDYQRAFHSSE